MKIALCPIRGRHLGQVATFLHRAFGLEVVRTTPEEHDCEAAPSQGLIHLIAKVLVQMEQLPSRITTRSFDLLHQAVNMVRYDPPEVFDAIELLNLYAPDVRRQFFELASRLDTELQRTANHK